MGGVRIMINFQIPVYCTDPVNVISNLYVHVAKPSTLYKRSLAKDSRRGATQWVVSMQNNPPKAKTRSSPEVSFIPEGLYGIEF